MICKKYSVITHNSLNLDKFNHTTIPSLECCLKISNIFEKIGNRFKCLVYLKVYYKMFSVYFCIINILCTNRNKLSFSIFRMQLRSLHNNIYCLVLFCFINIKSELVFKSPRFYPTFISGSYNKYYIRNDSRNRVNH